MIARIFKAEVCVIYRSRRLRRITQTEALIILAIMRKPNPIIVLLCIYLSNVKTRALKRKWSLYSTSNCNWSLLYVQVCTSLLYVNITVKEIKILRNLRTRVVYDYFFLRKAKNGR